MIFGPHFTTDVGMYMETWTKECENDVIMIANSFSHNGVFLSKFQSQWGEVAKFYAYLILRFSLHSAQKIDLLKSSICLSSFSPRT